MKFWGLFEPTGGAGDDWLSVDYGKLGRENLEYQRDNEYENPTRWGELKVCEITRDEYLEGLKSLGYDFNWEVAHLEAAEQRERLEKMNLKKERVQVVEDDIGRMVLQVPMDKVGYLVTALFGESERCAREGYSLTAEVFESLGVSIANIPEYVKYINLLLGMDE